MDACMDVCMDVCTHVCILVCLPPRAAARFLLKLRPGPAQTCYKAAADKVLAARGGTSLPPARAWAYPVSRSWLLLGTLGGTGLRRRARSKY